MTKNRKASSVNLNRERMIRAWAFEDAPEEFKKLSDHGGDEDWVAHIPKAISGDFINWMEEGTAFGCCRVSEHKLPDGSIVRIGAHA